MIKLFLAEDEIAMREGIRRHIHWEEEGIEFCGEAGDGELALPLILQQKPDILITDIKMPFMDGLELAAEVKKQLPDTKIVILSGYSEFEYAQEALRLGVTEYLLKPITPKKLKEVIRKLADSIEEERASKEARFDLLQEELREKDERDRRELLMTILSSESGTREILQKAEEVGIRLSAVCYRVLLVFFFCESDYRKQDEADELLRSVIDGSQLEERCFLFEHGLDSRIILMAGQSGEELEEESSALIFSISAAMDEVEELHYFICISSDATRLSSIRRVYREAYKTASCRFFLPLDQTIRADTPIPQILNMENRTPINTEIALQNGNLRTVWENFLHTGTLSEAKDFVEGVFSSIGESNGQSIIFLNYLTMDCYFCMARFLKEMGREPEDVNAAVGDINTAVGRLKSAGDAKHYLEIYLEEVIRQRDNNATSKNNQLLQNALDYIDEHYTDGSLTLQDAASAASLSPNRFSSLFSHEMGMTFIEYLIGKRMERACELLMTTDLKSFEVAYNSGYNDPHYFSTTFKKVKGMSPMEYRRRGQAQS